jgi:MFS superfamily sulfate permease-like transporter
MPNVRDTAPRDLLASVVVFLVALPLCLGIAIASGVPPALGLITGIVGGLVVGAIAGAPLQVSGPAAGLVVLVYEIVQTHGLAGLGVAVFVAGLVQLAAGSLRLGQWFRAISPAVVYGMLAGIGALIFAAQFHVMLDDAPRENGWRNLLAIPDAIGKIFAGPAEHQSAAFIGVITIVALVCWNAFAPRRVRFVPGALVGVGAATLISALRDLNVRYVQLPDSLGSSTTLLSIEGLALLAGSGLLLSGITLAFVASAETLLSASAVDRMHDGPRAQYDRELMAQGFGNVICGLLGALPMTGVIVRSAANVTAGARTRLATILHAAWLLLFVLAFPGLLQMVPIASLAAVLVHTGYRLIDFGVVRRLAALGNMPVVIYLSTLVVIVVTDLLTGILVGLGASALQVLYRLTHFEVWVRQSEDGLHVHLTGAGTFIRLPRLLALLESLPASEPVHVHVHQLGFMDDAVLDSLATWEKQRRLQGGAPVHLEWDRVIGLYRSRHQADERRLWQFVEQGAPASH